MVMMMMMTMMTVLNFQSIIFEKKILQLFGAAVNLLASNFFAQSCGDNDAETALNLNHRDGVMMMMTVIKMTMTAHDMT